MAVYFTVGPHGLAGAAHVAYTQINIDISSFHAAMSDASGAMNKFAEALARTYRDVRFNSSYCVPLEYGFHSPEPVPSRRRARTRRRAKSIPLPRRSISLTGKI